MLIYDLLGEEIPKLTTFANTLKAQRWRILTWDDYHISMAKQEGSSGLYVPVCYVLLFRQVKK